MTTGAEPEKILLFGAAGFIGANIESYFLRKGYLVYSGHYREAGHWRSEMSRSLSPVFVKADITDWDTTRALISKVRPDIIINCATYGGYPRQQDVSQIYRVNIDGLRNILEGCLEYPVKAFLQAASSSEYGHNCSGPDEEAATIPDSHDAVAKAAASNLIQYYGKSHGLPCWALRLYSVYGPWEDPTRLVTRALIAANLGELPPMADPSSSQDFVHVDDVCRAFDRVLMSSESLSRGEIFNICTGTQTTLAAFVETLQKVFQVSQAPQWNRFPGRPGSHPDWYGNPQKTLSSLGWKAELSLEAGLLKTAEWLLGSGWEESSKLRVS